MPPRRRKASSALQVRVTANKAKTEVKLKRVKQDIQDKEAKEKVQAQTAKESSGSDKPIKKTRGPKHQKTPWITDKKHPFICSICGKGFTRRETLQSNHFSSCVRANGNPNALVWDSHPTCWKKGATGPIGTSAKPQFGYKELDTFEGHDSDKNDVDKENAEPIIQERAGGLKLPVGFGELVGENPFEEEQRQRQLFAEQYALPAEGLAGATGLNPGHTACGNASKSEAAIPFRRRPHFHGLKNHNNVNNRMELDQEPSLPRSQLLPPFEYQPSDPNKATEYDSFDSDFEDDIHRASIDEPGTEEPSDPSKAAEYDSFDSDFEDDIHRASIDEPGTEETIRMDRSSHQARDVVDNDKGKGNLNSGQRPLLDFQTFPLKSGPALQEVMRSPVLPLPTSEATYLDPEMASLEALEEEQRRERDSKHPKVFSANDFGHFKSDDVVPGILSDPYIDPRLLVPKEDTDNLRHNPVPVFARLDGPAGSYGLEGHLDTPDLPAFLRYEKFNSMKSCSTIILLPGKVLRQIAGIVLTRSLELATESEVNGAAMWDIWCAMYPGPVANTDRPRLCHDVVARKELIIKMAWKAIEARIRLADCLSKQVEMIRLMKKTAIYLEGPDTYAAAQIAWTYAGVLPELILKI